jgi:sugar-phosphatase
MYNTNKIQSILFDMDGTVLESEGLFARAEHQLLKGYGVDIDIAELNDFRGMGEDEFYPRFISRYHLTASADALQAQLKKMLFMIFKTDLCYVRGFCNFYERHVRLLKRKTALVTNTSLDIVTEVRNCINIDMYFDNIITSSDVSEPKPSPVPYQQAMGLVRSSPEETLIIEDSSSGLRSALDSGAMVVGLPSTLSRDEIHRIHKSIIVLDSYDEIRNFLDSK